MMIAFDYRNISSSRKVSITQEMREGFGCEELTSYILFRGLPFENALEA